MNQCPRCDSTRITRSHTRNLRENFLKLFNYRAYRCIHCGWRGILKGNPAKSSKIKTYSAIQIAVIVLITIITLIAILYWINREEPKPEITTAAGIHFRNHL